MKYIIYILLILAIIGSIYMISLIDDIAKYFKQKKIKLREDGVLQLYECTNRLLSIITNMIQLEVLKQIQSLNVIGQSYNIANFDKDVEFISKKVYESIKQMIVLDYSCVSKEYISLFIIENTKTIMLTEIKALKENIIGQDY